jgi:filamentous hemagglutinin family protein
MSNQSPWSSALNPVPPALLIATIASLLAAPIAQAQLPLAADTSLGSEASQIIPLGGNNFEIDGGAARGSNLFHSFQEFNVNDGGRVDFRNPAGVETIFSRVTGNNSSNILGTLGVLGNADLFLLNPNGILFGPNASLGIGGSFVATTADGFQFGDRGVYSARNPEFPSPLLTIAPSAFFFGSLLPGIIENRAVTENPAGSGFLAGLQVPDGESLVLLGGDVILDGGRLTVVGGRIALGSVAGAGTVGFGGGGHLTFPVDLARGQVTLANAARAVAVEDGGDIRITAGRINLENSRLAAGIELGQGTAPRQAGDIVLDATEQVIITDNSLVLNDVLPDVIGNAGDVIIFTGELQILNGSIVSASTFGNGNAGTIQIQAGDRVTISSSDVFSRVEAGATGTTAGIDITTGLLEVVDGSQLTTSTLGTGNAGPIELQASDRVSIVISLVSSRVESEATGQGGDIAITTGILEVLDGTALTTATLGTGDAGSIQLEASERVTIAGRSPGDLELAPQVDSQSSATATGNSGTITITTPLVQVFDGSELTTSTFGTGRAGTILITASDQVFFNNSSAFSTVEESATAAGGNIEILTGTLALINNALLDTSTFGQGDAGVIQVAASDQVVFSDSNIFSLVRPGAAGSSGGIAIRTPILEVRDATELAASTFGTGNAGPIRIIATDRATVIDSNIRSTVERAGTGNSGGIQITTGLLEVFGEADLSTSLFGQGNAGSIDILASDRILLIDGDVFSAVGEGGEGNGGNINMLTEVLEVLGTTNLSAVSAGVGNAGSVNIQAGDRVTLVEGDISSRVTRGGIGDGGGINIRTGTLGIFDGAQLNSTTSGEGDAGSIQIQVPGQVIFAGTSADGQFRSAAGTQVEAGATGTGGNIRIQAGALSILGGAAISATTAGNGNAGAITLRIQNELELNGVSILGEPSVISASVSSTATGRGGEIDIRASEVTLTNISGIAASSRARQEVGTGGNIVITTDQITLDNQSGITTETFGTDGGNITLNVADTLLLRNNSAISTEAGTARRGGNGGDITINNANGFIIAVPDENSDIIANAFEGSGGNIDITTQAIYGLEFRPELTPQSDITASSQFGVDGTVVINTPEVDPAQGLVALPTGVVDASSQIGQTCPTGARAAEQLGRFVVTGRGGIAPSPQQILESDRVEADWVEGESGGLGESSEEADSVQRITEAQGWVTGADGQVHLVAGEYRGSAMSQPESPVCP